MPKKYTVRVAGLVSKFVVNKDLIITAAGTELNQTQLDKARKAAEESKVTLVVVGEDGDDEGTNTPPDQGEGS